MRHRLFAAALAALMVLAGCGATNGAALTNTVAAPDGSVRISVPEGWAEDAGHEPKGTLVLVVGNGADMHAQVHYYADDGNGYTAKDFLDMEAKDYFQGYIVDKAQEIQLGENAAAYFGYSMPGRDEDGNSCVYRGYEYFISFGADVVEVDIFCRYATATATDDQPGTATATAQPDAAPTSKQLAMLRSIAESVQRGA